MGNQLERMKAIVAQAIAEARAAESGSQISAIHLVVYGGMDDTQTHNLFAQASTGTEAEGTSIVIEHAGSRYICWNCCGLRFEGKGGVCPNCGQMALEVPEEIAFALRKVEVAG